MTELCRATAERPARLGPADLEPLRAIVGDGALDYTLVIATFHFINRIADLLHVDLELLPAKLRRLEPLRRLSLFAASRMMRRMDLRPRTYPLDFESVLERYGAAFDDAPMHNADPRQAGCIAERRSGSLGQAPASGLRATLHPLSSRPWLLEVLAQRLLERANSSLSEDMLRRIHRAVAIALPQTPDDSHGFHPRPADPIEALAFVGTRYASRTTEPMITALRGSGFDDLQILDAAIAIADANQWERLHRLLGLPRQLFSLD